MLLWLGHASTAAEPNHPPFVAGFERFARPGDLASVDAGGLLISELNCVACHATTDPQLAAKGGPSLVGAANRLRPSWLTEYLADPQEKKSGTTMPHLMEHMGQPERKAAIEALAAFLGTQQQPFETVRGTGAVPVIHEFWNRGDPKQGRELYHTVGCVACHQPDEGYETSETAPTAIDQMIEQLDAEELKELGLARAARRVGSVPHGDLVGKYTRQSLTMFLLQPDKIRKGSRMPSLRLSPTEAADITAHLLSDQQVLSDQQAGLSTTNRTENADLIAKGRALFVEVGCANCHQAGGIKAVKRGKPLVDLDADSTESCLSNPTADMPVYDLDSTQVAAIHATLKSVRLDGQPSASQMVHRRMLQLNCYACHQRDTVLAKGDTAETLGGVGRYRKAYFEMVAQVDLGDEGRLPPPLTGVGQKLQAKALKSVFDQRTPAYRHHMRARMPAYHPDTVKTLVEQLPKADQVDAASEKSVFGTVHDGLQQAGRALVGTGCVECHPFGGESLPGVIGVDLAGITSRVRPQWFRDFIYEPGAVKSRTRMPTFFLDGKSNRPDLLNGDVDQQIASLWFYLKDLANQPLPEKIAKVRSQNYELRPENRPLLLRSFMLDAGTHAIAVGFPEHVHYAFDAEGMRLATGWKGRFLDARGTWFERFTPPADPLGDSVVRFPAGVPLAVLGDPDAQWPTATAENLGYRFEGFRLDAAGVPTLMYRFSDWQIEDRIEPVGGKGLRRQWLIRNVGSSETGRPDEPTALTLRVHQASKLTSPKSGIVEGDGMTVQLVSGPGDAGRIRSSGLVQQWLLPLKINGEQKVVVEYTW